MDIRAVQLAVGVEVKEVGTGYTSKTDPLCGARRRIGKAIKLQGVNQRNKRTAYERRRTREQKNKGSADGGMAAGIAARAPRGELWDQGQGINDCYEELSAMDRAGKRQQLEGKRAKFQVNVRRNGQAVGCAAPAGGLSSASVPTSPSCTRSYP